MLVGDGRWWAAAIVTGTLFQSSTMRLVRTRRRTGSCSWRPAPRQPSTWTTSSWYGTTTDTATILGPAAIIVIHFRLSPRSCRRTARAGRGRAVAGPAWLRAGARRARRAAATSNPGDVILGVMFRFQHWNWSDFIQFQACQLWNSIIIVNNSDVIRIQNNL